MKYLSFVFVLVASYFELTFDKTANQIFIAEIKGEQSKEQEQQANKVPENTFFTNRVMVTEKNKDDLKNRTQNYINTYFSNTPASAEMLVNIAQQNNFPLDFLLLQGHLESHMCTKGRGAQSNNCHNVDNTDAGDYKPTVCGQFTACLADVVTGEQKFINLIQNCYFNNNEEVSIQKFIDYDFRIQRTIPPYCSASVGSRYMTDGRSRSKYENGVVNYINPIFEGYLKEQ